MNTTVVKLSNGKKPSLSNMIVTSPRPYSRLHVVSVRKASSKISLMKVAKGESWMKEEEMNELTKKIYPLRLFRKVVT